MLNQSKFLLQDLNKGLVVYCKPQSSINRQLVNSRGKDKGSWAYKQAIELHQAYLKNHLTSDKK